MSIPTEITLATPPAQDTNRTPEEHLGLQYLTSYLQSNGLNVSLTDAWLTGFTSEQLAAKLVQTNPQLFIGFSCYVSTMPETLGVAKLIRGAGVQTPIIAGGFGPTFHPTAFLENEEFGVVVRGGGEVPALALARHFKSGSPSLEEIPGISYRDSSGQIINNRAGHIINDLDSLPFPTRPNLRRLQDLRTPAQVLTARGCLGCCTYCSINAFQAESGSPKWRERTISNIVNEIEYLANQGITHIKLTDDSLIEPPRGADWSREFADELEKRSIQVFLRASIRADRVTEDVVSNLKRAGLFSISCGIENWSDSALKRMGKSARVSDNEHALAILQKYGIYVQAGHILFDHGTSMKELEANYALMQKYVHTISKGIFTEMYAAEGTAFTRSLRRKNILVEGESHLGNNRYLVQNPDARKVYYALKAWHKSHTVTYDLAIDPLSSPKALWPQEQARFHDISVKLRRKDLAFMRGILDKVHSNLSEVEILEFTEDEINKSTEFYAQMAQDLLKIYQELGLPNNINFNPFLN